MLKGVEWHNHLNKVTEPLPHPHLLHMRGQLRTVKNLTDFKLKTNELKSFLRKGKVIFLTSIYGVTTQRSRVKETPEDGRTAHAQDGPLPPRAELVGQGPQPEARSSLTCM